MASWFYGWNGEPRSRQLLNIKFINIRETHLPILPNLRPEELATEVVLCVTKNAKGVFTPGDLGWLRAPYASWQSENRNQQRAGRRRSRKSRNTCPRYRHLSVLDALRIGQAARMVAFIGPALPKKWGCNCDEGIGNTLLLEHRKLPSNLRVELW